jgi:nitric oxide reductase subunit B
MQTSIKKRWIAFAVVIAVSFAVLLGTGLRIYLQAPPIPTQVVTSDGSLVVSGADIEEGQP